ncbi:hypothetical protein [Oryzomonas rubra]|uniref:Uncharacterized protein n=1 Tax=Oryzomonas rubra TaxID=2509454 RepID=A0A5A9XKM8_9BACT|nr:hypothetical protein [Oryzomonas rubra]KAA0892091.1 hypothetical protein ET418_07735 [Oryzomonas rubra]
MLMPMTAEDVVVGIFCHLKQHDKVKLSADRESLHRAFFDIKKKFPRTMSVFTFREREQFPESVQLDQALSNLDAAGLISRQNLTPRYYLFENPLVSSYDKFSKKILSDAGIKDEDVEALAREIETLAICGR